MSKAAGGFLRFLLGLLILAAVGYNFWQVRQLRAEVAALQQERSGNALSGKIDHDKPSSGPSASSAPFLGEAQQHAERAQEFLRKKLYADARREIALATEALRKSGEGAQRESRDALASLRKAAQSLSEQAGGLWEQDSGSGKSGQGTSAAKTESEKAR